ncbi:TetR/AcrR family transcriptional regulator [Frondihabitans cladoniiphilus]|uniref:TetR/AcrR family transcriptional regulator n=1 Tax=Frondihabitans cladoniiphilus TaxID=715785 RepID=A0ABP8W7V7_9MICO
MPEETAATSTEAARPKRSDARRNEGVLLEAAAAVFVRSGVEAPIREIAKEAGVGLGTVYRHFPTRSDLVLAVYRHQVEACAEAAPRLLISLKSPSDALRAWVDLFVEFLVTKHGLAMAMQSSGDSFDALHDYFETRLVPAVASIIDAATDVGEIRRGIGAFELMRGIGNLCIVPEGDARYDARRMVAYLLDGLRPTE